MPANIDKALTICGWMSPGELLWLAEQASQHAAIAEVGSWLGRSTRAMAWNTSGSVTAVDTWKRGMHPSLDAVLDGHDEEWLYRCFWHNVADLRNVSASRATSIEAAQFFHDHRFDMIFLDAGHEYEEIRADILAWRPLLAEGGLLCGHDYTDHEGVRRAVDELIPNPKIAVDSIWYA